MVGGAGNGWSGEVLRAHRRRAGLTQRQLSQQAGVSLRALRDIEQGRVRQPRPASLRRLAAAVGLDGAEATTSTGRAPEGPARPDAGGAAAHRLTLGVLGPLTVHRDGRPVAAPPLQRALLGLLALQPDQLVGHEEIIDTLWGEHPPPTCRNLIHSYVARLRTLLEPGEPRARRPPAQDQVLVTAGRGYLLSVGGHRLDLLEFDHLLAQAHEVRSSDAKAALELLDQALGCWHGPVLADLPVRLRQHPAAVALAQRRVEVTLAYADLAMELREHARVVERLQGLVAAEPLHEALHARLMLALAGAGQQAAALETYTHLRERLTGELGVEPGPELQQAQARVLQGDLPGIQPPVPAPPAAGSAAEPPPPAQLPADVAGFTGRGGHLEQLDALLPADGEQAAVREQPPTAVVITAIAGTAGVGKTALAVHWAHRVTGQFPDGQLYVNLQGYAAAPPLTPLQALAGLLRGLGVEADRIPTDVEEAAALYRSLLADRRVLVVLDNAHDPEQVRPLLPGSPGCMVVVTSRDRLTGLVATHSAHRLTLDVLTPTEALALLNAVLGAQRVAAEPEAAAALARACGHLPLALRIAAANLTGRPEKSVAEYLNELREGDRLGELEVDGDPQAAVRAAFDHSYDRLSADSRRLFRLLGLTPGPEVCVPGAAALAGMAVEVAGRLLNELVERNLVEPRGRGRYGLHDLLGLYARQRAEQQDGQLASDAALGRLLDWYLQGVDTAAPLLYPEHVRLPVPSAAGTPSPGFTDPSGAAAWLEAELTSLVAAVQHAAGYGPRTAAWLLADGLRGYFWLRRSMVEWRLVAQAGLDAAQVDGDVRAQAAGHYNLGLADQAAGRSQPALQHLTTALALARRAGWTDGQAAALNGRGVVALWSGDLRQAAREHAQALALYRHSGRLGGQATCLINLGSVLRDLGRLHEAAQHHTQALRLHRQLGSQQGLAHALGVLGEIDHDLGRPESARQHLTGALRLFQKIGSRFGQALFLPALAALDRDTGHATEALAAAQDALRLAGEIGNRSVEAWTRNTLASIHLRLGHSQAAGDHYRQTLTLTQETTSRAQEAAARLGLAAVCLTIDQPHPALDHAHQALATATHAGMRVLEGQAHTTLAGAFLALGHHHEALDHAEQALSLHQQTGHRLGQARALHVLGCLLRDTGDPQAAARCWREALELFTDIGSPEADTLRRLLAPRAT